MKSETLPRSFEIDAAGLVRLGRGVARRVIRCLSGIAWVTLEGDSRDHVLGPGKEVLIESPGLVVVQALRPARLIVSAPRSKRAA